MRGIVASAIGSAVHAVVGASMLSGCGGQSSVGVGPRGAPRSVPVPILPIPVGALARGPLEVWSAFDLPDDPRSREISGIAWDEAGRRLYCVQDETRDIVVIRPDDKLTSWRFDPSIPIAVEGKLDLEGIVLVEDGFVVVSEAGPRILELDREGRLKSELPLSARVREARPNQSLESLTTSPSRQFLYTTTEGALECDGPIASGHGGTRVRILKMDRKGEVVSEHAYETDPANQGGQYGISELVAIADDELLVLERGWAKGYGNSARIYRVVLDDPRASCGEHAELTPATPMLAKTLLADIAKLDARGVSPAKQLQASPLLDNYEGLTIGPRLPDGRPTLIMASDDNARPDQIPRIVVLTTRAEERRT